MRRARIAWATAAALRCGRASGRVRKGLLALAGVLAIASQPLPAQSDEPAPDARVQRAPIFDRVPGELPRAAAGRWDDWSGDELPPEELRPWVERSIRAYELQDFPTALQSLYELLERAPDYPPALYQLGIVYFRLRRYADARVALERFLEVAPSEIEKTQALAHCHYSLGDYAAAADHYAKVLASGAESLEAHRGYALTKLRLGDFEDALEEFDVVLAGDPTHGDAWSWKARILFDLGRSEEALDPAQRGVAFLPFEPRPWFILSQVLHDLGRAEEADEAFERFEELTRLVQLVRHQESLLLYDPSDLDAYVRLIGIHREIGDLGSVRGMFARAFAAFPRECKLRFWSLDVLLEMNDKQGARVSAKAIEEQCGDDPQAWKQLEAFYGRIRDTQAQIRCGERYLRMGGGK